MKFTQSKLLVETSSESNGAHERKGEQNKNGELSSFPVVIDDVASSTWLICCRRALSRRIIIIILGHFPLTFEYFHSKFNNFKALGEPEVPPPGFSFFFPFFLFLFLRRFLASSRNRSPLFYIFVSIWLRVRVEQSAHTFYS